MHRLLIALLAPLAVAPAARAQRFADIGPTLGLPTGSPGASPGREFLASVSAADLDGDGDRDLVTTDPLRGVRVYLRDGAGFVAATAWTDQGEGEVISAHGHTLFDMDGDGDLDLFVASATAGRLFRNDGQRFIDVSASRLPTLPSDVFSATAADIDGDRDLDLLVARYIERLDFPMHVCHDNLVYENDGAGRFRDISEEVGIRGFRGCSFMMVAFDLDADHDLDFVTVNDFSQFTGQTELWRQDGRDPAGRPHFSEVSAALGLVAPLYGMGVAIDDLDQNGSLDFFFTNIGEPLLFELTGVGADARFHEVGTARRLSARYAADANLVSWVARAHDVDGDGALDVLAATGTLPTADFIANPTEMSLLWLAGGADGALTAPPRLETFGAHGSVLRDVTLVDVDGDERPEIVGMHIHGGVSVLRDLTDPPAPTRLMLVASATAPGAAGAAVTLTCGALTRTRHVSGGGAYGNADLGEVYLSFGGDCVAGKSLSGRVRWPSGYVQAIDATSGETTVIREHTWLTLGDDALAVDLRQHLGSADVLEAAGSGVVLGAVEVPGSGRWRWPLADAAGDAFVTLTLDGAPLGVVARVGRAPVELWLDPPRPVAGRPLSLYVRFADAVEQAVVVLPDGVRVPLAPFEPEDSNGDGLGGRLMSAEVVIAEAGSATLAIESSQGTTHHGIEVGSPVSVTRSEVVVRDLYALAGEDLTNKQVKLRVRLVDENSAPSEVPSPDLGVKIDGVAYEPLQRLEDGKFQALELPHTALRSGAVLQIVVAGADLFPPLVVTRVNDDEELGALVSPERSHCKLSEPHLRADGSDRGTALVRFEDAQGVRLPELGTSPLTEGVGVSVVSDEITSFSGGFLIPIRAGTVVTDAEVRLRLPGQAEPVRCAVPLVAPLVPLAPVEVAPGSPLKADLKAAELEVPLTLSFVPQGVDGRALGSGVVFRFEVEGVEAGPIVVSSADHYVGLGRYQLTVVPHTLDTIVARVVADDGGLLAELLVPPHDEGEPGPELAEEAPGDAEDAPEVGEAGDATEVGPDDASALDEPEDAADASELDAAELSPEPPEPPEEPEAIDAPDTSVDAEVGAETAVPPEPDAPAETLDAPPEPAAEPIAEPAEPQKRRDDGCSTSGSPLVAALLGLAALAFEARRIRRESKRRLARQGPVVGGAR